MKITNNVIEIDVFDIAELSPEVTKALQSHIGERLTIEGRMSDILNELITEASKSIVTSLKEKIDKLTDIQRIDIEARLKAYVPDAVKADVAEEVVK